MKRISLLLTLVMTAMLAGTSAVSAHHTDSISVAVDCLEGQVVATIKHNIYGGHKLQTIIALNGNVVLNDKSLPDSRYTSTRSTPFPHGTYVVKVWARALYPNGYPESQWKTTEGEFTCNPKAKVKTNGPAGDPFHRFNMRNTGDTSATCIIHYQGRDGKVTIKHRLAPDQGFRTGWRWVQGSTKIRMSCWSGGERIFHKVFRAANAGFYGPLWKGFERGFYTI